MSEYRLFDKHCRSYSGYAKYRESGKVLVACYPEDVKRIREQFKGVTKITKSNARYAQNILNKLFRG